MKKCFIKVPSKIIITGEHFILHDCPAIVTTVDKYLEILSVENDLRKFLILFPSLNQQKEFSFTEMENIFHSTIENYELFLSKKIEIREILKQEYDLIACVLQKLWLDFSLPKIGITIKIRTKIPIGSGMGSSASIIIAIIKTVNELFSLNLSSDNILELTIFCENLVHGKSSGLDARAIIFPGVTNFFNGKMEKIKIRDDLRMFIIQSGRPKSSTGDCVNHTMQKMNSQLKKQYLANYNTILQIIEDKNLPLTDLIKAIKVNHNLLIKLGVTPLKAQCFANQIEQLGGAFKICGAGTVIGEEFGAGLAIGTESKIRTLCKKFHYKFYDLKVIQEKIYDGIGFGSIMLLGEHAVLHGYWGICAAIDKKISVKITELKQNKVQIISDLGNYIGTLKNLPRDEKFSFIIAAIKLFKPHRGLKIEVKSSFSANVGLGSSAAVVAAVCSALAKFCDGEIDKQSIFASALKVVQNVQKCGSGADLAAAIFGGIIGIRKNTENEPEIIEFCTEDFPKIMLFYCGYKMKTPDVVNFVENRAKENPQLYQEIYQKMGKVSSAAKLIILKKDWKNLGEKFHEYQYLMNELGVCDETLEKMILSLKKNKNILGVKISGSGLGDCIVAIGKNIQEIELKNFLKIPISIGT